MLLMKIYQYPLTTFSSIPEDGLLQQRPFQTVPAGHLTHVFPYSKNSAMQTQALPFQNL